MSTANFNRPEDEPEVANEPGEIEAEIVDAPAGERAQAELAQARAEAAQFKDQLLRALAEAENTRRRSQREREESARYAAAPLGKDIVQVADNLQRALAAVPAEALANDEALRNLVEGIAATERQFLAALDRHNIKRIDPLGEKFDAHLHQAMFEVPGTGQAAGTVVQVLQPGYVLYDRLLRPALVGVAKADASAPPTPANSSDDPTG
jgi:molecular chaperone GrpE